MTKRKGFTLIELLVVIAIIGLLSTLAVISLNTAREKARDARRVSDIKQIQTALELSYTDNNAYPASVTIGGAIGTYMNLVPNDPQASSGRTYTYTVGGSPSGASYSILYILEGVVGEISAGIHQAIPGSLANPNYVP